MLIMSCFCALCLKKLSSHLCFWKPFCWLDSFFFQYLEVCWYTVFWLALLLIRNLLSFLSFVFMYVVGLFSLIIFRIFSLPLLLNNLIMMYFGVILFMLFCFGFAKILGSVSLEFSSYLENLESLFLPIPIVSLSYNHLYFIFSHVCVYIYIYFTFIFCPKANGCSFSFNLFLCFILNSLLLLCSEVHGYFLWCPICLLFHPVYFFISYTVGLFIQ